jgi:L-2,4-diaminobutyrate decarboxylase
MSTEPELPSGFDDPAATGSAMDVLGEMLDEIRAPSAPFVSTPGGEFALKGCPGMPLDQVLREVKHTVMSHAVHPRHPWAMAHMVPPPLSVSIIADLLIGAMNQCAFIWEEAPAAADLESAVVGWLGERLGYGRRAAGLLTSGGTESNRLAIFLALDRLERRVGSIHPRACVVATDQAHVSLEKAATLLGLGPDAIVRVPTDEAGRLAPETLGVATRGVVSEGRLPVAFVCTAGTTNSGALEPIDEFLAVAAEHDAWCHVDAAYGGFVRLLPSPPPNTDRWASANSISWDAHKTLHASYAAGALLLRDPLTTEALDFTADYASGAAEKWSPGLHRFDGSRRLEALKLWMCIKHLGVDGYARLADRCRWLAQELAECVRAESDLVLATPPDTSIVCFRYQPADADLHECDEAMLAAQRSLFRGGGPLLSCTRLGGRVVLRAVLLNPAATKPQLHAAVTRLTISAARELEALDRPRASRLEKALP